MASRRKENQEKLRFIIIRLLNENPNLSTRKIAEKVGISNGSAFYILNALIEKGFVKIGNFISNPKKKSYVYLLTPQGIAEKTSLTIKFLKRKKIEFEELKSEIKVLEKETKKIEKKY